MEILNTDCFEQIFNKLSLSDLFHLRTVSRRIKQEVDDHLPRIRSLPLYLTTPRTWITNDTYEYIVQEAKDNPYICASTGAYIMPSYNYEFIVRLTFGTSGLPETFEDRTILQNQNHFRLADFIVINNSSGLTKLLSFIKKNCPKIEKLAVVIDHCEHYLPKLADVLNAFLTIKVLLVESTFQDSFRYDDDGPITLDSDMDVRYQYRNQVIPPPEVYHSILGLDKLEELYFFSRKESQLRWTYREAEALKFVMNLLGRLRAFHYNIISLYDVPRFKLPLDNMLQESKSYDQLEELACTNIAWPIENSKFPLFPKLKKLIWSQIHQSFHTWFQDDTFQLFPGQNLEVLYLINWTFLVESDIKYFAYFPKLERFLCKIFWFSRDEHKGEIPGELKNWTIKHLQVIEGPETAEERNDAVREYRKYFLALQDCVFELPEYSVIRVSDLQN